MYHKFLNVKVDCMVTLLTYTTGVKPAVDAEHGSSRAQEGSGAACRRQTPRAANAHLVGAHGSDVPQVRAKTSGTRSASGRG